jgi:repressor of nif and glnA expression
MNLTSKQRSIMKVIIAANPDETGVDIDQLLERLDYTTTKASIQFSLRALIGHGLIRKNETRELRRDRLHTILVPTTFGKQVYGVGISPVTEALIPDDELFELIE